MTKNNEKSETMSSVVLGLLKHGAVGTIDVLETLMYYSKSGYYRRLRGGTMPGEESIIRKRDPSLIIKLQERRKFYAVLSDLKRQGFVNASGDRGNRWWQITKSGLAHLGTILSSATTSPTMTRSGGMTIVSYDIPESMRRERRRLREILRAFDFNCIQKSVWFGNKKLTEEFVEMLHTRRILSYVHIFEISKTGTMEQLVRQPSKQS